MANQNGKAIRQGFGTIVRRYYAGVVYDTPALICVLDGGSPTRIERIMISASSYFRGRILVLKGPPPDDLAPFFGDEFGQFLTPYDLGVNALWETIIGTDFVQYAYDFGANGPAQSDGSTLSVIWLSTQPSNWGDTNNAYVTLSVYGAAGDKATDTLTARSLPRF